MHALKITTVSDLEVMLTRTFDAPSDLVFEAFTSPNLLRRWYAPEGWSFDVCDVDLKVGGQWRFVMKRPSGKAVGQFGVYREIVRGKRLVNTESWEDWNPGECLVTLVLMEKAGRTTVVSTVRFPSQEVRDVVVKNGLEKSAGSCYDQLERLLASTAAKSA